MCPTELQYTFLKAGDYSYNCGDTDVMGNFTVVPTIHSLSLCQGCDPTLTVATGDSVKWVVVPDHDSGPIDCTVRLVDDMKDTTIRELFMGEYRYILCLFNGRCTSNQSIAIIDFYFFQCRKVDIIL